MDLLQESRFLKQISLNHCPLFFAEVTENTVCVGLARVGALDQKIASGTLQDMSTVALGDPLHSMIITGILHPLEVDMLKLFAVDKSIFEHH